MKWILKHPQATIEMLGLLPSFLDERNPASVKEQLHHNYNHGGGWMGFDGFQMLPNGNLSYPGDPPTRLIAETKLRDEIIRFYEDSWVVIIQPNGSWEVARMD